MKIKSIFSNNGKIPAKYTSDGENINPPLEITELPDRTKTITLIIDDPDAFVGTWTHWIIWNIPVKSTAIKIKENSNPGIQGLNDFKKLNYGGPAPPSGTHRYFFKIYAIDTELNLEEGTTRQELERTMQTHILEKTELVGLYERKSKTL